MPAQINLSHRIRILSLRLRSSAWQHLQLCSVLSKKRRVRWTQALELTRIFKTGGRILTCRSCELKQRRKILNCLKNKLLWRLSSNKIKSCKIMQLKSKDKLHWALELSMQQYPGRARKKGSSQRNLVFSRWNRKSLQFLTKSMLKVQQLEVDHQVITLITMW